MKKVAVFILAGALVLVAMPAVFLLLFLSPSLATAPPECSVAGTISGLTTTQSAIVDDIGTRAQMLGLTNPAIATAVTAALALTGLNSGAASTNGVGIFNFLPSGQWGPADVLSSSSEDALLFLTALDTDGLDNSTTPAAAASEVMNKDGVAPQPVTVTTTTYVKKKKVVTTKVVYEQPTPAFFAPFVARALTITSGFDVQATAAACGAAAPITLTNIGSGALPAGYQVPIGLSTQRREAVGAAIGQIGNNYVWAAADPAIGFDCSGLVMWAWDQASPAVALSHYTVTQWQETTPLPSLQGALPGDLVLTPGSDGTLSPPNPQHVGMYIGDIAGIPWVVAADDPQVGVVAQTYASFIAGGLIAVGHIGAP